MIVNTLFNKNRHLFRILFRLQNTPCFICLQATRYLSNAVISLPRNLSVTALWYQCSIFFVLATIMQISPLNIGYSASLKQTHFYILLRHGSTGGIWYEMYIFGVTEVVHVTIELDAHQGVTSLGFLFIYSSSVRQVVLQPWYKWLQWKEFDTWYALKLLPNQWERPWNCWSKHWNRCPYIHVSIKADYLENDVRNKMLTWQWS